MTRVGFTGHQGLSDPVRAYVTRRLKDELEAIGKPIVGYCSLAEGADQIFAELVLQLGGSLHAIVPSRAYESTFDAEGLATYNRLLSAAIDVEHLDFDEPGEPAYDAAGKRIADLCDVMFAVWDGEPARGKGGTADAVSYSQSKGKPVVVVWPEGVERE